ncbi:MAG: RluA family pseudouridine synthase [Verrucomicrobia bacterium]|nr:RluA family pseudouridine synthase [Verrucomicrobiota bacterium]
MPDRPESLEQRLARVVEPLPGATPYDNTRPISVAPGTPPRPLIDILIERFPHIPAAEWESRCDAGRFTGPTGRVLSKTGPVAAGSRVIQHFPATTEPAVATDIRVVHEDDWLLVLDKPAPLPMHPAGRFNRNTLQHFLRLAMAPEIPLPVHRLDANTTGLVVFARDRGSCHALQRQFAGGTVAKRYLVRVHGHPPNDGFELSYPISNAPGQTGTHAVDHANGRPSHTGFTVLSRLDDGTSLLEARPGTGRTNQIRIHLWQAGYPICGDPAYLTNQRIGATQTLAPEDPPMALHALRLAFRHPRDGRAVEFVSSRELRWTSRDDRTA